ncbi:MAG: F0F1 ATP synthase subunit A [Planctomycetota bacterium]
MLTPTSMINLAAKDPLGHNYDYPILSLPNGYAIITNHVLLMILVSLFLFWFMRKAASKISIGNSGTSHDYVTKGAFWHIVEVVCVFFREEVARPVLGDKTDRFLPFIWTVFFFVLFHNLIGMVPLLDATKLGYELIAGPGGHSEYVEHSEATDIDAGEQTLLEAGPPGHPTDPTDVAKAETTGGLIWFHDTSKEGAYSKFNGIGGTPTGNIYVTFILALVTIIVVILAGIRTLGLGGFLKHLTLDAPIYLWPLTIIIEIIGLFAKPFALMVRLFANMTAGHVLLAALIGFSTMGVEALGWGAGLAITVPSLIFATLIGLLEILVAMIQAYVFAFLATVFISLFQHDHHEHDEHEEAYEVSHPTPAAALQAA